MIQYVMKWIKSNITIRIVSEHIITNLDKTIVLLI